MECTEHVTVAGHADGYVLLVDDDGDLRAGLAEALEESGFRVIAVGGGKQALAVVEAGRVTLCVVLVDWLMPEMGGGEVIERMARDARFANTPVYVVTSSPKLVSADVPVIDKSDMQAILGAVRRRCPRRAAG